MLEQVLRVAIQVNYGRLATGIVFLVLFLGFELHVPAIQNLIPGSYAGLTSTNYLGFAFLLGAVGALGGAFRSVPNYSAASGLPGPYTPANVDPRAVAAAMMAMQQVPASGGPASSSPSGASGPAGTVPCPVCGAANLVGAKFCQGCGRTFGAGRST